MVGSVSAQFTTPGVPLPVPRLSQFAVGSLSLAQSVNS